MATINWVAFGGVLVDLVIASIILSHAFWGYRRGLVNVIFKVLTFIISLIIMFVLYKPVANMIMERTEIDEWLSGSISSILEGTTLANSTVLNVESTNVSEGLINEINSFVTEALQKGVTNVVEYVSVNLAKMMIYTGTMLLLFIVARFGLFFVRFLAEIIGNLPIVKTLNKSGGLVVGIVKGFLVTYAIFAVLSVVSPLISGWGVIAAICDSHLGSAMYNNNILLKILFNNF